MDGISATSITSSLGIRVTSLSTQKSSTTTSPILTSSSPFAIPSSTQTAEKAAGFSRTLLNEPTSNAQSTIYIVIGVAAALLLCVGVGGVLLGMYLRGSANERHVSANARELQTTNDSSHASNVDASVVTPPQSKIGHNANYDVISLPASDGSIPSASAANYAKLSDGFGVDADSEGHYVSMNAIEAGHSL